MKSIKKKIKLVSIGLSVAAVVSAEAGSEPFAWPFETEQALGAHVQAELVQRAGGEWVMTGVTAKPIETPREKIAWRQRDDQRFSEKILAKYARAFKSLDVAGLNRVWVLNPDERAMVERLFETSDSIDLRLDAIVFRDDGERSWIAFDQYLVRKPKKAGAVETAAAFGRTLGAHDAYGAWRIGSDGVKSRGLVSAKVNASW